jgi:hypothetical protein
VHQHPLAPGELRPIDQTLLRGERGDRDDRRRHVVDRHQLRRDIRAARDTGVFHRYGTFAGLLLLA